MKKIISLLLILALALSVTACGGKAEQPETTAAPTLETEPPRPAFQGLVLKAPKGAYVSLHSEFEEGITLEPADVYTYGEDTYYCFAGLLGAYRYKVNGSGYYTVTKNLVMTQEKNAVETLIDVTPGKLSGEGWEPKAYQSYTDELLQGSFSDDLSQWPAYAQYLTSPWYTQPHGQQQITTQSQMEEYLHELDDGDDRMYLFSAGTSGLYRHDIPMVIFTETDLSSAQNVDEAASLLGQEKPTVMYRAQMHGNEPAGGEGALAVIGWLDSTLGTEILGKINVCVIPRQSPDGAQNYERTVLGGIDPNRDSLQLKTPEIIEFTRICQLLEPELIIDGHEYNAQAGNQTQGTGDILVGVGHTNENTEQFRDMGLDMASEIFAAMTENGLDYRFYSNYVNSVNANISRAYWSLLGTQFILLETRGIGCGLDAYNRRVMVHLIAAGTLLRYAAENASQLQENVTAERQSIIARGSVFRQEQSIALDTAAVEDLSLRHPGRKHDQLTGTATEALYTPKVYSVVRRSRVAPTAYVIPAGEGFTEGVLKLMDRHDISYTFIPAGSVVSLRQYTGDGTAAELTEEKNVTFPAGAYVLCRNQVQGNILSMLMEPDVTDAAEQKGTLVQQGMIFATDGKLPIYRYVHDLNDDGFIDYQ